MPAWAVFILAVLAVGAAFVGYAACIVGGRADDDMERYDARTE